jgi:spermidine synthase
MEYYTQPVSKITKLLMGIKEKKLEVKTKYQHCEIIEFLEYGLALVLDKLVQVTEVDEYIYHEMLVHPSLITHDKPSKVLIIGGGDGCVLREVLKHPVNKVTLVDIDGELVEICKKYLTKLNMGSFEDNRVELVIMDGKDYVEISKEIYDCIILDLTDPFGPEISKELYSYNFYKKLKRILDEKGIIVTQAGSSFYFTDVYEEVFKNISGNFKIVREYNVWIPSFGYNCCFITGSDYYDPLSLSLNEINDRINKRNIKTKFYNANTHYNILRIPVLKPNKILS